MAYKVTFGKCIICTYKIGPKQNELQCKQYFYLLHQKCTNVRIRKHSKDFKTGGKDLYVNIVQIIHA